SRSCRCRPPTHYCSARDRCWRAARPPRCSPATWSPSASTTRSGSSTATTAGRPAPSATGGPASPCGPPRAPDRLGSGHTASWAGCGGWRDDDVTELVSRTGGPRRIAGRQLTRDDLFRQASAVAARIACAGAVAVHATPTPQTVVAVLGGLLAG